MAMSFMKRRLIDDRNEITSEKVVKRQQISDSKIVRDFKEMQCKMCNKLQGWSKKIHKFLYEKVIHAKSKCNTLFSNINKDSKTALQTQAEVNHLSAANVSTCYKNIRIHDAYILTEVDTGSCVNLMALKIFKSLQKDDTLKPGYINLTVANGQQIATLGLAMLKCYVENKEIYLDFYIVENMLRHTLIGRTGIESLWPSWRQNFENVNLYDIKSITDSELINSYKNSLLREYADVFGGSIKQPVKDYEVHITVDPQAVPVFRKFYRIPYSLEQVKKVLISYRMRVSLSQLVIPNGPRLLW